ncbi:MAG: 3-phosphoshikimate 1-carboxyvinyltransferase [Clostridia bacterium]|jgi:3-phosphoshikimate 1-carboxyvinyltransferase|nr:3-phosphoshikimate 1-carboxyvinyltransferase [Clostridia bacterium]MBT7122416.1 3-phosphoshikimate 1-carboxyvinyltransferase [Clostridia bacterium]
MRVYPSKMHGSVTIPPSKSVAHRAIIAAALSRGKSEISNIDLSSDIKATIRACEALGCEISIVHGEPYHTVIVNGGIHINDIAKIDCCESGSTMRFLIPIACAISGTKVFSGSGLLPIRPIDAYFEIFEQDGIVYKKPAEANLPLTVQGTLKGGDYVIDGSVSSQYITGLLFALPMLDVDSTITIVNKFESKGYVDITLSVLEQFGIEIVCAKEKFSIRGNQQYKPQNMSVEGDFSQAAFFLTGGCISGDICVRGLSEKSLQPDKAIVDILRRMGGNIEYTTEGLGARKSALRGIEVDVSQCPDIVPPIAVAAALAKGETQITGAARLRIKESDRLESVSTNLNNLGIETSVFSDGITIEGGVFSGGCIDSFNDHRITMAFSMAALCASDIVDISGEDSINKSYPKFFEDYVSVGGKIS